MSAVTFFEKLEFSQNVPFLWTVVYRFQNLGQKSLGKFWNIC